LAVRNTSLQVPTGYITLLKGNRNYRSLWMGEVASLFGDWFNLIASAALVSHLTQSGLAIGGLFVVRMLAPFLVSPLAGVVADRYNRKLLLILADISRAIVVLGFLFVRDPQHVWVLYTLTAIQLGISGFFFPTRNAMLPDIVSPRELGAANALSSATWSVMLAIGAAAGGLVAGWWGLYPAFVIDSFTFFVSAFFIAGIHYQPKANALANGDGKPRTALAEYVEGLRFLRQNVDIFTITLHKFAQALTISGAFQVVMVTLAERVFTIGQGGGTSLGLMYAVAGVGTGLGPILARSLTGDRQRSLRIALALSYAICLAGLALVFPMTSFALVLFGSFLRAIGLGINWVFSTQLLLQLLPNQVRGRVFSTEFAMFTLANEMGAAAGGWILDNTSLSLSGLIFWMGILTVIPGVLWLLWITLGKSGIIVPLDEGEGLAPALDE
jgi:MFS family permease